MAKKIKKAKSPKKPAKSKGKCLLTYTEDSSPKAKLFDSEKDMNFFIESFRIKYSHLGLNDGYWFDLKITGITGKATNMDPCYNPFDET